MILFLTHTFDSIGQDVFLVLQLYDQATVIPYFISLSGDLADSWITPFYFIEAGTSSAWGYNDPVSYVYSPYSSYYPLYNYYTDVKGNGIFNLGLGYRLYLEKGINFGFSLSYKIQNVAYYNDYTEGSSKTDVMYRRINFKFGFGF